jgi:hypothetical protein
MKRLRKKVVSLLATTFIIGGCCGLPLYWLRQHRMQNDPALVYRHYERQLHSYAERLMAGAVYSEPDYGYAIPQFLIDHGARYVRKQNDCFVVIFGFMPTDAVPELWYSPKGFAPLPTRLEELKRHSAYFRWEELSPNWGACFWDQ